jgi:hypothetical protein
MTIKGKVKRWEKEESSVPQCSCGRDQRRDLVPKERVVATIGAL